MSVNTYKINYLSTIVPYRRYNREMKTLANSVNFDKNDAGKFRLKVIKHAEKYGWRSTCDAYGISKSSYYRWRKLLFNSRGKLLSLIPRKTTPKRVRQTVTNKFLLSKIKQIRSKRGNLGKDKIKVQLDEYAHRLGIASISAATIGRIIKRYHLYQKPYRQIKRKSKYAKNRVKAAPRITSPGFIEVDCVTCSILSKRYYFVSLIDIYTKMASVALLMSTPSSRATRNALISFQEKLTYPIVKVQTDNGSEFLGRFHDYLETSHIPHDFTYPHSPKINGVIERFNRTLQEEFLNNTKAIREDILSLDDNLQKWLDWYNQERPRYALKYQTPIDFIKKFHSQK